MLSHPDCDEVRYPVEIARQAHWDGVAPGDDAPTPVWLPPRGQLGPDEVYVPAGWFRSGGDPEIPEWSLPARRLWCEALVVQRFPVTNARYLAFLDDLVAQGRTDEALRHAPRVRRARADEEGSLLYGFDGERFSLVADGEGHVWLPDYPVVHIDWFGARAWLAWWAQRTGRPWRLPGELEWEKAARGVDGRFYPWGDSLDPSWCCMTDSHPGERLPAVVDSFPVDTSVYGVRGLGGNVRDWCVDVSEELPAAVGGRVVVDGSRPLPARAHRTYRGGAWHGSAAGARSTSRHREVPNNRIPFLGVRGFRPVPEAS
jgi:serine/threonine-protein kinase